MKRHFFVHGMAALALLLAAVAGWTSHAQGPQPPSSRAPQDTLGPATSAPLSTSFTYQGQLKLDGEPVNSECWFAFRLYDDSSATDPIVEPITTTTPISVTNGLFTVDLDFGSGAFAGDARWLGIQVKCSSEESYTPLGRQALTAAPYAQYAVSAGQAFTATQALAAPWGGLADVPEGFGDGIDNIDDNDADPANELNATMALNGTSLELADGGGTLTVSLGIFQQHYANVVVVAKSGGNFTTITAALDSITDASDTNHYLVRVMPGVYTETVTMKSYVDIEGSGELTTRIIFTGGSDTTGTVVGANDAELRFLTVENTGGDNLAIAICNNTTSPRLTHVTAVASGGTSNYGVRNNYSWSTMTDVTASALGDTDNYGVYNAHSSPTMTGVTASAAGGNNNYGVYNYDSRPTMTDMTASVTSDPWGVFNCAVYNHDSSPIMTHVTASAFEGIGNYGVYNYNSSSTMTDVTASAAGGTWSCGVHNESSSPTMTGVTATASEGTNNYGVYNYDASPTMHNCTVGASSGTINYGIYNDGSAGSHTVRVNNSRVTGSSATICSSVFYSTLVGATLLDGGTVITNSGTITCAGVYDGAYTFYASTCP